MADSPSDISRSFHIINLGCKVNRVESDDFAATLLSQGAHAVDASAADLIIVNTCTVTGEAEKKTRKAVRQALRANDCAQVVVTGCAAAIDPATYTEMSDRVRVVPKLAMHELLARGPREDGGASSESPESEGIESAVLFPADAEESAGVLPSAHVEDAAAARDAARWGTGAEHVHVGEEFPTRVGVKVQDGCNNACTYCIVHVARGRAWSRPAEEIVDEVRRTAEAGAREIVLTGINLGSYSYDGMGLADLLRLLLDATDADVRFRVSSIEPRDVDDDLIALMAAAQGRICRHLHLPLQSGSTKVLREMARPYKAEQFKALVDRLYAAMPMLSLSTDVIVGFPGETEEDYQATEEMARACRFSKMHIFRYSKREGTSAARRADQVAPEVKADRAKRLEAVEAELRAADFARRAGTRELALVESDGVATTESYHAVAAPAGAREGDMVEVVL